MYADEMLIRLTRDLDDGVWALGKKDIPKRYALLLWCMSIPEVGEARRFPPRHCKLAALSC
jgi:hypothetical protein